ncbi:uncharacterized protein LY79DRAFT_546404 [Colletotrichum navitas]|uniref:Secreted protein n=1 Tax=Colletotrichum navitas TaxID=681940 RepID=A0AAD8Q691_9PEZI|nr:uncharacterized protein LY79DRAFT_546404 [Colletotrichum navitas]KAK1595439.1 hypothetical protein LY79DRAFT_546404 [Colletotrichum navitas]
MNLYALFFFFFLQFRSGTPLHTGPGSYLLALDVITIESIVLFLSLTLFWELFKLHFGERHYLLGARSSRPMAGLPTVYCLDRWRVSALHCKTPLL